MLTTVKSAVYFCPTTSNCKRTTPKVAIKEPSASRTGAPVVTLGLSKREDTAAFALLLLREDAFKAGSRGVSRTTGHLKWDLMKGELRKTFPDVSGAVSSAQYESARQDSRESAAGFWSRLAKLGNNVGVSDDELLRKFRGGLNPELRDSLIYLTGTVTVGDLITHLTTVEARLGARTQSLAAFHSPRQDSPRRDYQHSPATTIRATPRAVATPSTPTTALART